MLKLSPNQRRYSELFLQWKERLYRSRRTDHVSKNDDDGFGILSHQFLHHLEIKQNLKDNCDELNKPVVSFKLNELHKIHIESIIFKLRL